MLLRFIANNNVTIPFMKMRFVTFVLSILLVVASLFSVATQGLNFGIDFKGGTLI